MRQLEVFPKEEASLTQTGESKRSLCIQSLTWAPQMHSAPRVGEEKLEQRTKATEERAKPRYMQVSMG